MFTTTPAIRYSTLGTGARVKVLATVTTRDGAATARTVVTLPPEPAAAVTASLNHLADQRDVVLYLQAHDLAGQVCYLRRELMHAVHDGTGREHAPAVIDSLTEAAASLSAAARRALADEAGILFAGTEDVLVPVALTDEYGHSRFLRGANSWLTEATDEELAAYLTDEDSAVLYEGLLARLRQEHEDLDTACDTDWIDVAIDDDILKAWLRRHRPHLLGKADANDQ